MQEQEINSWAPFQQVFGSNVVALIAAVLDEFGESVEPFDGFPPIGSEDCELLDAQLKQLPSYDHDELVTLLEQLEKCSELRALTRFAGWRGAALRFLFFGATKLILERLHHPRAHESAIATVNRWRNSEGYTPTVEALASRIDARWGTNEVYRSFLVGLQARVDHIFMELSAPATVPMTN